MIISHKEVSKIEIDAIKAQLKKINNPILPLEQELVLLDELNQFPLGQFLLANKGLNGYWTAYVILHGPKKSDLHPLEDWLLNSAPGFVATQQRFQIFKQILQSLLKDDIHLASIPCGLMDDLLGLDYSSYNNFQLTGIDLDESSLELAAQNAKSKKNDKVSFYKKDAWQLDFKDSFDVITSNGLNIYEQNSDKVIALYKQFNQALTNSGYLVTSFITPPPTESNPSTWQVNNPSDAIKQAAIFIDILQAGWQCYRTENETIAQLEQAGFTIENIVYDQQKIFPTVLAKKQS